MATDDPLDEAIELLTSPAKYIKTYGGINKTEDEMVFQPIIRALRLLIGEVQSLRGEVDELRGQEGSIASGGIQVFDPNDRPWRP
ncbi:hypothetical protein [Homoserinibacter sp. GY 40078]|uniref:hypothetical protein n=1 Tax=Homoserinibacter sp. GY 40078 TaxID=2603275 RepID=UPI0011C86713|nr:hypothetical protein [Homoserinibacter sp. GY 40078]TXK17387.1 hypothetical protein FVQ89_11170 [Homoserinibacter sp. GY 40078]